MELEGTKLEPAQRRDFANQKRPISIVLAIAFAAAIASFYWIQQWDWLNGVTLEVQASSAPRMAMKNPTRGTLLLKTASGDEQTIKAKVWVGPNRRLLSVLRFDFPLGAYEKAIFFPDPSLQEVEVVSVRLIAHHDEKAIALPLDRVQGQQNLVTKNRAADSVSFKRISGDEIAAIDFEVGDLLNQIDSPRAKPYFEAGLVFLFAFLAAYWCLIWSSLNAFRLDGPSLNAFPAQSPLVRIGIVLGLVACMAAAASENSHADEYLHVEAARYYMHHWLPPSIDSEWVVPSFSHYGLTYLAGIDIGYFFAGKFALFFEPFFSDIYTTLRFFNVGLFAVLLFWSARVFRDWHGTWVFFLTPQLWYAFAGYNTESWALFMAFLLIGQVASKESSLQHYLRSTVSGKAIRFLIPALLLSCLLLLSKINFFLVVLFFATWLLWQLVPHRLEGSVSRRALKILPLILLPLLLRFGVQTYESAVNKGDLPHAIVQQAERYADPDFKPSALRTPGKGFEKVNMKARGYTLGEILIGQHWLYRTIASFYGAYGWMAFFSPRWFYLLMELGWLIFIGCMLRATFTGIPKPERVFCGIAWLYLPLIIMISLYYSWTQDFQAQGRYLFPFLPILFYVIVTVKPRHHWLLSGTVWGLFVLGAYDFIFFGLKALTAWNDAF
jgi:hypothetical protein